MITYIIGIIGGLASAIGFGFFIAVKMVKKSNDIGNFTSGAEDVLEDELEVIERSDHLISPN